MHIEQVRVEIVAVPFRDAVISGAQRWEEHRAGLIVLDTDDGRQVLGEFVAPRPGDLGEDVSSRLRALLEGLEMADPVAVEGALREVDAWPFVGHAARSAVESAFVDLLAQASGRPVSTFLDPQAGADVAVNALLGIVPPDGAAEAAAALVARGYRCLKLKAGDEPDGALVTRVRAVREAVGPAVALRLDFNGGLTVEAAAAILDEVGAFELEYVEQPIAPSAGAEAMARLRWTGSVPIAADESVRDVGAARVLLETGAVDALVVKPARVGGLRQAAAIIELATSESVPVTVSTLFETGVGITAATHLAAIAPGPQAHGLATAELLASDLLREPLAVVDGRLRVPAGPGLGVQLDDDAVARYRVA